MGTKLARSEYTRVQIMKLNRCLRISQIVALVIAIVTLVVICHAQQNKKDSAEADKGKNTSPNVTVVVKQENPPHITDNENEKKEDIEIQNKLTNFTGGLVVVGVLQTLVLGFTAWLIKRQADQMIEAGRQTERIIAQMKDTTVRQLRAYVGVARVFLNLTDQTLPVGGVVLQNFGQTPAYKVKQWIGIAPGAYPLSIPLLKPDNTSASIAIMSPSVKHSSLVPLKKPLPANLVAAMGTAALTIYVYGGVTYEDAFGVERYVTYRFIYGGTEGTNHVIEDMKILGVMNPDTSGNESN